MDALDSPFFTSFLGNLIFKTLFLTLLLSFNFLYASPQEYKNLADKEHLAQERYWQLLLHMADGESEIDDPRFFFSKSGKTDAKLELEATLDAFLNETTLEDNSSLCRFPARAAWLKEKLHIDAYPEVECREYKETLKRLSLTSATLVFPAAHINSPASMFGHTFLRINSKYNSKLLAYAINYAADADPDKTNGVVFAIKGLFGGYFGTYSLLPYYEKLKEYRDAESRDVWEYDLNFSQEEVLKMVRHMWELNGTHSYYYFFTENCSYNMLWLMEVARPSVHLREYFSYEVIPLETVHATKEEGLISTIHYRESKRTKLLRYEKLLNVNTLPLPKKLVNSEMNIQDLMSSAEISIEQKQYVLEASIEYLEYSFSKNSMKKSEYLKLFHKLSRARASLGSAKVQKIKRPQDPLKSHRAIRLSTSVGVREGQSVGFVGIRPAYHDIEDSNYGFLRGTQIEFMNLELSYAKEELALENATILSIVSLAQRSEFFDSLSWRTKFGWDRNYLDAKTNFSGSVGAGFSWGNEYAYTYILLDPLFYVADGFSAGLGGSLGLVFDKFSFMSTNFEATRRYYDSGDAQNLVKVAQSFRVSQNFQLKFKYEYKERVFFSQTVEEETFRANINYYF